MKKILVWVLSVLLVLVACAGVTAVFAESTDRQDNYTEEDLLGTSCASHSFVAIEEKAATCTQPGHTAGQQCENCGTTEGVTVIVALGHDMKETAPAQAPTCTADGSTAASACSRCDYVVAAETVAATGHDMQETEEAVAPTCATAGKTAVLTCANGCGHTEGGVEIPATDHDYASTVTAPTCEDNGFITYVCNVCGDTYEEDGQAAFGHAYVAEVTEPTCTLDGYTTYTCSVCWDTYTADTVPAPGHYEEIIPGVPATELETGLTDGVKCSVCDEILTPQEEIPALGVETPRPAIVVGSIKGKPGDIVTVPVTLYNNPGIFSFTLSVEYDTTYLTRTGATINVEGLGGSQTIGERFVWLGETANSTFNGDILYLTFQISADAPEGDLAVRVFYNEGDMCNYDEEDIFCDMVPGKVIVTTVDAPDHTHDEGYTVIENNVEAGCETDGSYDRVVRCTECNDVLSRETVDVPATDHNYEPVVTLPTCTENGYTTYTCSGCDSSYVMNEVDATGHTEETIPGVPATETETGLTEGKKCSVCDEILKAQEIVPALGGEDESESDSETESDSEPDESESESDTVGVEESESEEDTEIDTDLDTEEDTDLDTDAADSETDKGEGDAETTKDADDQSDNSTEKGFPYVGVIVAIAVIVVAGAAAVGVILILKKRG